MSSSEPWNHEHKCFNVLYKSLVRWASSRIWRNDVICLQNRHLINWIKSKEITTQIKQIKHWPTREIGKSLVSHYNTHYLIYFKLLTRYISCGNFTRFTTSMQFDIKINWLDFDVRGKGHSVVRWTLVEAFSYLFTQWMHSNGTSHSLHISRCTLLITWWHIQGHAFKGQGQKPFPKITSPAEAYGGCCRRPSVFLL